MTDDAWFGVTAEPIAEYGTPSLLSLPSSSKSEQPQTHFSFPFPFSFSSHMLTPWQHAPFPCSLLLPTTHTQLTSHPQPNSAIAHELHQKALDRQRHQPHHPPPPRIIVDLFAGAGGNTIALARAGHWDLVVAVEIDPATLACAQHNAAVYGVPPGLIRWVRADCLDFLDRLRTRPWELHPDLRLCQDERDALAAAGAPGGGAGMGTSLAPLVRDVELFASPPWGGPLYSGAEVFDLEAMEPYGVGLLHRAMAPMAHGLFLPRNGDLRQLADLVPDGVREKLDVVQYCIKGGSKGIVAYYPMNEPYESS